MEYFRIALVEKVFVHGNILAPEFSIGSIYIWQLSMLLVFGTDNVCLTTVQAIKKIFSSPVAVAKSMRKSNCS